jgi:hypothetical protein
MIVLVSLCAVVYAAAILVFRTPPPWSVQLVAMLFPIPLSLFFGPAVAWALPIGATASDLVSGYIQIGSLFGLGGNFLMGFLPYALWTRLKPLATGSREVILKSSRDWMLFGLVTTVSGCACSVVIAWPLHWLGLVPFQFLVLLIGVQNIVLGLLSAPLVILAYPRIRAMGMLWWDTALQNELDDPDRLMGVFGAWLVAVSSMVTCLWVLLSPDATLLVGGIGTLLVVIGTIMMW